MSDRPLEIRDDEFRVIRPHTDTTPEGAPGGNGKKPRFLPWICALCLLLAVALLLMLFVPRNKKAAEEPVVFDPAPEKVEQPQTIEPLSRAEETAVPSTEALDTVVNDVPMTICIPHGGVPSLAIGTPDIHDKSIILASQAADIRADNGKITGAFIVDGKILSGSMTKLGFCAIIDGKITVGTAKSSPLFEEAADNGGHFFRQYPLVNNGQAVENEPKGKALRKALCQRGNETFIVLSGNPESFHDFAQALADLQIDNAIYLVGSDAFGFRRDINGRLQLFFDKRRGGYKYENYIIWRGKEPATSN